jgi:hypothetical protein
MKLRDAKLPANQARMPRVVLRAFAKVKQRVRKSERAASKCMLALLLASSGCDCAPMPVVDAGAPSDATSSDAPYVCAPRDECPSWCNWTPCGCVTDNPALSCE